MTKIRVHELAKEFGMASKEMEARIKDFGFNIKNYMSTLEDYEAGEIRQKLRGEQVAEKTLQKEAKPKTVIRRKHQVIRLKKIAVRKPVEPEEEVELQAPASGAEGEREKVEQEVPVEPGLAPPAEMESEISEAAVETEEPAEAETVELQEPEMETTAAQIAPEITEEITPAEKEVEEKTPESSVEDRSPEAFAPEAESEQKVERPEPKSFVKILDRPRIVIPKPAKPAKQPVQRPVPTPGKARPRGPAPPVSGDILPPIPEKTGKKKGKRVVQISDMESPGRRRRPLDTKRKGRLKPISKLLVDELGVGSAATGKPLREGQKSSKAEVAPKPGTVPPKAGKKKFAIYETIQVGELAKRMSVKVGDVIMRLMGLGAMVTANQSIDHDIAALVASEFGYEVERKSVAEDLVHMEEIEGGELVLRPPVVTVMGHVDHGKTSLLDAIRHADVVSGEAGGITQHIGAYHVTLPSGNEVVFLDTPGHEAFTAMRSRGAKVTDIVILVVAADDGVMAQTREAIDHSRAAGVPIIVAINKIDKPGANPDRVKAELAELGLVPEDWGGDTIFVNISAKQKIGIEELLEMLAVQAEVMELKADPDRSARGHVVEAQLDKGRGPVATLLVSEGTLRPGDALVCGLYYGRVRAMMNDKGGQITAARPSMPVEIQGLSGVPEAGNEFTVLPDEKKAREVAEYRQRKAREAELVKSSKISLENVFERLKEQELKELNIILKTDVQGSIEALSDALQKLSTQDIKVNVVRSGIGAIAESDVLLASASDAIVIGFNVRPSPQAKALAEQEQVEIRFYDVIYHALDEIKSAMVGLLEPVYEERTLGRAEVRDTFNVPKVGTVAGCHVQDGLIKRGAQARLLRDNVVVYTGKIASLRRFKEDVREVQAGYECGIGLERFNDVKVGDVIEAYKMEEVAPVLGESLADMKDDQGGNRD
jgi:translation initiation factor IF-2